MKLPNVNLGKCISLCIFLTSLLTMDGQNKFDALEARRNTEINSTQKASSFLQQIDSLKFTNPDLALSLVDSCAQWFDIEDSSIEKAKCHFWRAWLTIKLSKRGEASIIALAQARISHKIFKQESVNFWLARSLELIASIYSYQGKLVESQKLVDEARLIIPKIKSSRDSLFILAELLNLQGWLDMQTGNQVPVENFLNSAELYDKIEKPNEAISVYQNLIAYYGNLGKPDSSKMMARIAIMKSQKSGLEHELGMSLFKLGQVHAIGYYGSKYQDTLSSDSAFYYFDQGQNFTNRNKFEIYKNLTHLALEQCKGSPCVFGARLAKPYFDMAIKVGEQERDLNGLYDLMAYGQVICSQLGNCNEFFIKLNTAISKVVDYSKSAVSNASNQFSDVELAMLASEKSKQIRMRQNIIWGMSITSLLGVLAFYIFFQRYKIQSLNKELLAKDAAARAQLNPHFISNTLNAINALIETKKPKIASRYLIKFDRLCRMILSHSRNQEISLDEEITLLNNYLALEKLRFEDKLDYSVELSQSLLKPDLMKIPTMLLQPIVENAIKHGIKNKNTSGKVKVQFDQFDKDYIECIVEDDGIGREKSQLLQEKSIYKKGGQGQVILKERMEAFQSKGFTKADIEIDDLFNDFNQAIGTRVKVNLPILNPKSITYAED